MTSKKSSGSRCVRETGALDHQRESAQQVGTSTGAERAERTSKRVAGAGWRLGLMLACSGVPMACARAPAARDPPGRARATATGGTWDLRPASPPAGRSPTPAARARPDPPLPPEAPRPRIDRYGHDARFEAALARIGPLSLAAFQGRYRPKGPFVARHPWDPTTLPACGVRGAKSQPFDLAPRERARLRQNGFVVLGRHAADSFGAQYLEIWRRDLPVFVSADSVLHAWHRTFDAILEELEEQVLSRRLEELLEAMARTIPAAQRAYGAGTLEKALGDADLFLAVARSLLADREVATVGGPDPRLGRLVAAARAERTREVPLFGARRVVDFSQFRPRGHYTNSPRLKRYFRAMMWLGRIDLRVLGFGSRFGAGEPELRQLGGALVLLDLLERAERFGDWERFDRALRAFIGPADSMTFGELRALRREAGLGPLATLAAQGLRPAEAALQALQERIRKSPLGAQAINTHRFSSSPAGPDQVELPRSFTFLGQRETIDSWALGKVVADRILWKGEKVQRRMPSALDVAFTVLGNDHAAPLLQRRIARQDGVRFRDGLPVQHNLAAVRGLVDAQPADAWRRSIFAHWIDTLRTLSGPVRGPGLPAAMQTRAWGHRLLSTQLASWTELRHDTVLYVKQSVTFGITCSYPAGLVELRPRFWRRLSEMAFATASTLAGLTFPSGASGEAAQERTRYRQVTFLRRFAREAAELGTIATKQLAGRPLAPAEVQRLRTVVETRKVGCGPVYYTGWYPQLFYRGPEDSVKADFLVADVHTDPPAPVIDDPGGVLHEGVGRVDLLLVAARQGRQKILFAGPAYSHYELVTPADQRLTDAEWASRVKSARLPPRPEWTADYLVDPPPHKPR